jgi:membrane-bound metal-dependent hydrolase YbcI (DUF457 family)
MFIGHFGVALAAKKAAPRTSLGMLIFAAQLLDLIWPILLLLGIEHVRIAPGITKVSPMDFNDYPISHSLLTAIGWSVLLGGLYYGVRRHARGAWIVALAVLSHWILDWIVHRPDLPLWPGGARVGLGLWNSWIAAITAELLVFGGGLWIYLRCTRAKDEDALGRYVFWALMAFLALGWIGSLLAGPPPSDRALAWGGLAMWLMVPWAWWADKHRSDSPLPSP